MKDIKGIARGIKAQAREYPSAVRDEVIGEFVGLAVRDHSLSLAEADELLELLG